MTAWTEERRKKQAERIRQQKPWEKSTGPRTRKGKARSRMNALKHGNCSLQAKMIRRLSRHNRAFKRHPGYPDAGNPDGVPCA